MNDVQVGMLVKLRARASRRSDGEVVIPESVGCSVKPPGAAAQDLPVTYDGDWATASFEATAPGTWIVSWSSEGDFKTRGQMKVPVAQPLS